MTVENKKESFTIPIVFLVIFSIGAVLNVIACIMRFFI